MGLRIPHGRGNTCTSPKNNYVTATRQFSIFDIHNLILNLLSDAEILEDVAEDFVSSDFTGDFADVLEALAEVLRQEVA